MQKNWNQLEKETSHVKSNTRHLIRNNVEPITYTATPAPLQAPSSTIPERVEHSAEKFNPRDDEISRSLNAYDRTLERERKKDFDPEKKIPEDNNPNKPVEPPAKKLPEKGPGAKKLLEQF